MSEMLTLTVIVTTVSLSAGNVAGLVFLSLLGNPLVIAGAGIVIAALIVILALVFLRGGKKKAANAAQPGGTSDWQRQPQPGAPGTMNAWGQQGMPAGNAWGQPGQQQPAGWDAQQQQAGAWGMQNQQGWGAQNPAAQQQSGWGAQNPAQQQQQAWGTQNPAQQQPAWGAQTPAPQQQSDWGAQNPAQQQQQAWGTPAPGFGQQPQPAPWANQGAQLAGMEAAGRSSQAWDSTTPPSSQDQWAQPQNAPAWGVPGNASAQQMPAQQQSNPAAYSSGSGQSWGQGAQAADPWAQQQAMPQAQQGGWAQTYQPQAPSGPQSQPGNVGLPPWQQPGPGLGQGQPGFGNIGQASFGAAGPFAAEDGDRTMLRNTGSQTQNRLGIVRIEEGKEPGRVYEIRKDSLSIGRSRDSDVFLEDLAVSRLHASIINMGSGNYALKDEGSANGTKVNGQTVNKYQPFPLKEGDKIQLGQTVLVFAKR